MLWLGLWGFVRTAARRLRAQHERTHWLAHHDALTELPNRVAFEQRGHGAPRRPGGPSTRLLLVDLDRFKDVNDTFGHRAGDDLLRDGRSRG